MSEGVGALRLPCPFGGRSPQGNPPKNFPQKPFPGKVYFLFPMGKVSTFLGNSMCKSFHKTLYFLFLSLTNFKPHFYQGAGDS